MRSISAGRVVVRCSAALVVVIVPLGVPGCREPEPTLPPPKVKVASQPAEEAPPPDPMPLPDDVPARPSFPPTGPSDAAWTEAVLRDECLDVAETLLASSPGDPAGWVLLGAVHERFGDGEGATFLWNRALRLDPRLVEARRQLGDAALRRGQPEEAERHYRDALDIDPDALPVVDKLVDLLLERGDLQGAGDLLASFVSGRPRLPEGWCLLGKVRLLEGRPDDARKAFQRAIDADPTSRDAARGIERAIKASGTTEPVSVELFRRLEDRRPSSRADRRIDKAAEADLKRFASSVHYWAADAFARLGDPTRAAMAWRRAFEIDPEDGESREALALLLENAGRTRESMRVRQEWCDREPTNPAAWFGKGKLALALGLPDEAVTALERVVSIAPDRAEGQALLAKALEPRDPEGALAAARRAADLEPSADHFTLLGDVLARGGQRDGAIASYERALGIDPGHDRAVQSLARVRGAVRPAIVPEANDALPRARSGEADGGGVFQPPPTSSQPQR